MQLTVNEEIVAAIWKEVLGVDAIGIDDNFFDLGGNSLSMIQVYSRLRDAVQNNLTVVDLFRYPTVQKLAQAIGPSGPIQLPASPVNLSKAFELARQQAEKQRDAIERRRQIMQREEKSS
jgi:acyl carrier protein